MGPRDDRGSGSAIVIALSGDLDLATSGEVVELVRAAVMQNSDRIELDMGSVDFIDGSGLAGVLRSHRLAADVGCRLRVGAMSPTVHRLLELTGTRSVLAGED